MTASWRLGTIRGITIGLHWSLSLVFILLTISLATAFFPVATPELSVAASWIMAAIASILFFASILLHELGHSWMALRHGIPVRSITLFMLGGVAQITERPKSARIEFQIAIAGPVVSFALAALFGILAYVGRDVAVVAAPASWLAGLNLILGVFNLLPGFPLDGGRVLRAVVWHITGDQRRAARIAVTSGQVMAFGIMGIGALLVLGGNLGNGLWLIFIGWFMQNAAASEAAGTNLEAALQGVTVGEVTELQVPSVPSRLKIRQLIDEYVLPTSRRYFIVADDGIPRGVVSLKDVATVPRERWDWAGVQDVMTPWTRLKMVGPDTQLLDAMRLMDDAQVSHLPVVEGDHIYGLLTREDVIRQVRLRTELQA